MIGPLAPFGADGPVGDTTPALLDGLPASDLAPLLVVAAFLVAGVLEFRKGIAMHDERTLFDATPTSPVRSMAAGRVTLEGTARPADGTITQPFADDDCLLARWWIYERRKDDDHPEQWKLLDEGTVGTPFYLEDDTGRALVDATDDPEVSLSSDRKTRVSVGPHEREPPAVRAFLERSADGADGLVGGLANAVGLGDVQPTSGGLRGVLFDRRRRYVQRVVEPGDETVVVGTARVPDEDAAVSPDAAEAGDDTQSLVVGRDDFSDTFLVTDGSGDPRTDADARVVKSWAHVLWGLGLTAVPLAYLLHVVFVGPVGPTVERILEAVGPAVERVLG